MFWLCQAFTQTFFIRTEEANEKYRAVRISGKVASQAHSFTSHLPFYIEKPAKANLSGIFCLLLEKKE